MVLIVVTGTEVGRGYIYEERKMQGRRRLVPSYAAFVLQESTGGKFDFAVTRDSSNCVFGDVPRHFGEMGECPPSLPGQPYLGRIRTDCAVGWTIQLFEDWCPKKESLRGTGFFARQHILIHFGARKSDGCLMVSGGQLGWQRFKQNFLQLVPRPEDEEIHVVVQERVL